MLTFSLKSKIEHYHHNQLMRSRWIIEDRQAQYLTVDQQNGVNFSSNDYLGLTTHPIVKQAFIDGVQQYGVGSGASAMISGYFKPHAELEEKFAEFVQRPRALLFNSGYHANLGILQTLGSRTIDVVADKYCHASLLDGIQLSRAKHNRYRHGDVRHAAQLLSRSHYAKLLVTESVFSMEGSIAPIAELSKLSKKYHGILLVDDAHGMGVIGDQGKGICYHQQNNVDMIDCLVTPLGKAFGSMGALVSGKHELIEAILQFARTYMYSTALPPAMVVATLAALKIIQQENWRREKLQHLIQYFIQQASLRQLRLVAHDLTPIKTILVGDNRKTLMLQEKLKQRGFFISCIRPPTVPKGSTRIRISLTCEHSEENIQQLLDLIRDHLPHGQ